MKYNMPDTPTLSALDIFNEELQGYAKLPHDLSKPPRREDSNTSGDLPVGGGHGAFCLWLLIRKVITSAVSV
jgi:hypothetical protein